MRRISSHRWVQVGLGHQCWRRSRREGPVRQSFQKDYRIVPRGICVGAVMVPVPVAVHTTQRAAQYIRQSTRANSTVQTEQYKYSTAQYKYKYSTVQEEQPRNTHSAMLSTCNNQETSATRNCHKTDPRQHDSEECLLLLFGGAIVLRSLFLSLAIFRRIESCFGGA